MGEVRSCDGRCHGAEQPECECWCGGTFHGSGGKAARDAFCRVWGEEEIPLHGEPAQRSLWSAGADRWMRAMEAAKAAKR